MGVRDKVHRFLSTYLHGPGANDSKTVHPLTLQFLGPDQERLNRIFDEQRCLGIQHAQTTVHPLLVPTVLAGGLLRLETSSWQRDAERVVLGLSLLLSPLVLAWFSRYVRGGPSVAHWYVNNLLVFLFAFGGGAILDDHSGPLLQGFALGQIPAQEHVVGEVYSWVLSIGGIGWVAGYSLMWPVHPLLLLAITSMHLFWYILPIVAFEDNHVCRQLIPQMFLVATVDSFIVLGRMRVEFKEKLLTANTEMLKRTSENEKIQRKTIGCFCSHTVDAHMWLGADANVVTEDESGDNQRVRGMWPRENDRASSGPLYFQDLLGMDDDIKRFRTAVATSELADGSEQVQLVPCTLSVYDPGMMCCARKDYDVFVIRSCSWSDVDSSLVCKFLVGLRLRTVSQSPRSPGQEPEVDMTLGVESQAGSPADALERQLSSSSGSSDSSLQEGLGSELGSKVGSRLTAAASTTSTAMILQALRFGALYSDVVVKHMRSLGRAERWLISSRKVGLGSDRPLGEGGFGYVTRGHFLGAPAAIKRPHLPVQEKAVFTQLNELRLLRHIRHPHIAYFYGAVVSVHMPGSLALVMEFIDGPDLEMFVEKNLQAENGSWCRHRVLAGTCLGLMYLHKGGIGIVHSDLKPSNILVACATGGDPQAKIVDLGLSRKVELGSSFLGLSIRWCSPETLDKDHVLTRASDIFSFGYVIYFCLSGRKPWQDWSTEEIKKVVKHGISPLVLDDQRLALLAPMLQVDPKKRYRISQVRGIITKLSLMDCSRNPFSGEYAHSLSL